MKYIEKVHRATRRAGFYGKNKAAPFDKGIDILFHWSYVSGRGVYRGFQKLRGFIRNSREGLAGKISGVD